MSVIKTFTYDKKGVEQIGEWAFGTNWPVVYIVFNDSKAYVGETLDAVRRTTQHFAELEFREFTSICLISNKTFNKSVVLDLEAFLIKYMSADGTKQLINANPGIVDHNYFYKEAYEDDFKDIWNALMDLGIVQNSILQIENSELFKYSPYKTLNSEQLNASYEILRRLYQINNATSKSLVLVSGGAGTGKTILAVYLVKLLADISNEKKVWNAIEDPEDALFVSKMSEELVGIKRIGFVVPMAELRNTMKTIFKSIDGLSESMILAPGDVVKQYYDVLIVDEAHRLYQRKNLPGSELYIKFDRINKEIMLEKFTKSESDYTELDWIIRSSRIQILFYDEFQTIRAADIGRERFDSICKPRLFKYIELLSQMRCKGGNGYYEYIRDIIEKNNLDITKYKRIDGYELKVFDRIEDLFSIIQKKNSESGLCRVVTGPGWGKDKDIIIDGKKYQWAKGKDDFRDDVVFSIHKIQGFDLNFAGVIFGKEVYYDEETNGIRVNRKELMDNFTKSNGEESMRQYVLNIYVTLMTRGINGTYVFAVDENLREYLRKFLG